MAVQKNVQPPSTEELQTDTYALDNQPVPFGCPSQILVVTNDWTTVKIAPWMVGKETLGRGNTKGHESSRNQD